MMSLTTSQTKIVQTSFYQLIGEVSLAAQTFYDRLFELDPSLRMLFKSDMRAQGRKLMQTLLAVVDGLDNLDVLIPDIRNLGKRHVAYGVKREHYDTVGAALLWMLEQRLKDRFTPETKEAWAAAYQILVSVATEEEYHLST
jgi:hemoglobin-like flavoprotein